MKTYLSSLKFLNLKQFIINNEKKCSTGFNLHGLTISTMKALKPYRFKIIETVAVKIKTK